MRNPGTDHAVSFDPRGGVIHLRVKNCDRCGKVFVSSGVPICPDCYEKEEEQFQIVKKYLAEHKRATAGR